MRKLSGVTLIPLVLAIIGAINWGLVGFFNWDLVAAIFGGAVHPDASAVSRVIYSLVGLSGLALIGLLPRLREARPEAQPLGRRSEARP